MAGIARENRFEGQAAMLLERAIGSLVTADCYPLKERESSADWSSLIEAVFADVAQGRPRELIAARFHNALVGWIIAVAKRTGVRDVVLSGGVFQNAYLVERGVQALEAAGFRVATHQRIPANDGGIALGQAVLAGKLAG
jgi:hydrogenase maturation protein HypF